MTSAKLHIIRHPHPEASTEALLLAAINRANKGQGIELKIYNCPAAISLSDKLGLLSSSANDEDLVLVLGNSPKLVTGGCINHACKLLRQQQPTAVLMPDYTASSGFQLPSENDHPASAYDFLEQSQFSALNPNGMLAPPFYLENFFCRLRSFKKIAARTGLEQYSLFMLISEAAVGLSETAPDQQLPVPEQLLSRISIYGGIKRAAQLKIKKAMAGSLPPH